MREQMQPTEGVQGLQGFCHATDGSWDDSGNKLRTLCGTSISPNFRNIPLRKDRITCPRCRGKLAEMASVAPLDNPHTQKE